MEMMKIGDVWKKSYSDYLNDRYKRLVQKACSRNTTIDQLLIIRKQLTTIRRKKRNLYMR